MASINLRHTAQQMKTNNNRLRNDGVTLTESTRSVILAATKTNGTSRREENNRKVTRGIDQVTE
jgi:hypothetical protein